MDVTDIRRHRGEFFRVLQTTKQTQTAVMTIAPASDAGPREQHEGDQIIYVVEGEATITVGAQARRARAGAVVTIPARTHRVLNSGTAPLFLLTVYAPPQY